MSNLATEDRELQALVSLLQTENSGHLALLVEQMRAFPDDRLQRLAALIPSGSEADSFLNLILAERDAPHVVSRLPRWVATGTDLENGVFLVAQTGYPRLNIESIRSRLDAIAHEIEVDLPREGGVPAIRHMATVLRDIYGFHGNEADYYDPDNSYINRVLVTRTGLPISLSVLWILLGKRLDLQISGVGLPSHVIANLSTTAGTLYFDPFRGGELLSIRDVMNLVSATGQVFHPNHLRPATSLQLVQRMFNNLLHGYQIREDVERARLVRQYLAAL